MCQDVVYKPVEDQFQGGFIVELQLSALALGGMEVFSDALKP